MKRSVLTLVIVGLVIIVSIGIALSISSQDPNKYDNFAKCLTEKGVKMYGTYWCHFCANQKEEFGNSFLYVNYVECSLPDRAGQNAECNAKGIKGYPTWEFADGSRREGVIALPDLRDVSGCELP